MQNGGHDFLLLLSPRLVGFKRRVLLVFVKTGTRGIRGLPAVYVGTAGSVVRLIKLPKVTVGPRAE